MSSLQSPDLFQLLPLNVLWAVSVCPGSQFWALCRCVWDLTLLPWRLWQLWGNLSALPLYQVWVVLTGYPSHFFSFLQLFLVKPIFQLYLLYFLDWILNCRRVFLPRLDLLAELLDLMADALKILTVNFNLILNLHIRAANWMPAMRWIHCWDLAHSFLIMLVYDIISNLLQITWSLALASWRILDRAWRRSHWWH